MHCHWKGFQDVLHSRLHVAIYHGDAPDQRPITVVMNQELGLFTALAVIVVFIIRPIIRLDYLPINILQIPRIIKPSGQLGSP